MSVKSAQSCFVAGFFLALAVGFVVLAIFGRHEGGVSLATRSVARIAFVFFWFIYAARSLAALFGLKIAARYRRQLGLAFAGALLVHLALVAWLFRVSARQPISDLWIVYFVLGALGTFALTLGSWQRLHALWESRLWRVFSVVVIEYVAFLFFRDFVLLPLQFRVAHPAEYSPFALLIILGVMLRWLAASLAWFRRPNTQPPPSNFTSRNLADGG
jgi:hypothetical protein